MLSLASGQAGLKLPALVTDVVTITACSFPGPAAPFALGSVFLQFPNPFLKLAPFGSTVPIWEEKESALNVGAPPPSFYVETKSPMG